LDSLDGESSDSSFLNGNSYWCQESSLAIPIWDATLSHSENNQKVIFLFAIGAPAAIAEMAKLRMVLCAVVDCRRVSTLCLFGGMAARSELWQCSMQKRTQMDLAIQSNTLLGNSVLTVG
jgi:hypothetical protein